MYIFYYFYQLFPKAGPQKNFTNLQLFGCGFWDSDSIIVKFTSKSGSPYSIPRSCVGRLMSPGVIACRPPKLTDKGEYEVSLSLDGSSFIPDVLRLNIYRDVSISGLSPRLVDLRKSSKIMIEMVLLIFDNCKHPYIQCSPFHSNTRY